MEIYVIFYFHIYSFFLFSNMILSVVLIVDFTRIAAANTASDDVTN